MLRRWAMVMFVVDGLSAADDDGGASWSRRGALHYITNILHIMYMYATANGSD